ncbi:MAG: amino acid adenylation domain-containing protein, partial [Bacteroidales bacterium]|nr:amino acid adenylation domain-containing protein [Bacteroidales bacterium]
YQGQFVTETMPLRLGDTTIQAEDLRTNPPGIGLSVELFSREDGSQVIRFWYRPDQYSEAILRNFAGSFAAVVASMEKVDTVGGLSYLTDRQRKQTDRFQPAPPDFDLDKTVLDLFRETLSKNSDKTAVVYEKTRLSFAELDRLSDALAAEIEKTVEAGSVVSIILGRNEYMAVAPLAAVKAGCPYQPLDPSYPTERLQFMVEDAKAAMLIADPGLEKLVGGFSGSILLTSRIAELPDGKPTRPPRADDLFILLYTSGTTGKPKGCMLNHRNISAFVRNCTGRNGLGPSSRMTAYPSFGFDAFMGDLWTGLCSGATLHIIPEAIRLDLVALKDYFEENGITHAFMTTQVATQFAMNFPRCKGLKVLSTGGEKMASFAPPAYRLFNCYGPTEASCYTVNKLVGQQEDNVPIGRPFPGVHSFIATKNLQLLPAGASGELFLAGPQVGMGYLGLPEKTEEAFLANCFEKDPLYARMYRTGDIVRWRNDGDIEFVGRKDSQVKIRGFRIELKEVETVILDYPGISDATVQAFDEETPGGGKFLAAYVVSDQRVDIAALNAFILERKPPYMVPAVTMQIDKIPLNVNQKVDRKALPKPQPQQREKTAVDAPFNVLEQEIADLISETVHIDGLSLTEPLIYYGLTSLSALRLATELYKKYGVQMNMDSFVRTATLQSIENEVLKSLLAGQGVPGGQIRHRPDTPQPLTFQQAGVYFDCMKAPQETIYNIPMRWTLPDSLDAEKVKSAVERVLSCHPVVGARFAMDGTQVVLVPAADFVPKVECESVEPDQFETYQSQFKQPFNLSEGPLYHVSVVRSGERLYLFTDFHHLVFDGRSYDIFISQLTRVLEGEEPTAENYTYFDYAQDQQELRQSESFTAARSFFDGQMAGCEGASGVLPDLEGSGPGKEALLTKRVASDIAQRCRDLGISPASYYLAAAFLSVGAFCGSRKVFLCTISNGRSDLRTADTLGMFVNTLALASEIGHGSVDDYLKETDRIFSATLQHEYYPFAQVAADYGFQPQVMLAYQVGVLTRYQVNGTELQSENLEIGTPKFPLSIFIDGREGEEYIALEYDCTRFSEGLMQHFADTMEALVGQMLSDGPLDALSLVQGRNLEELDGFNRYGREVDLSQTIVSLFRRQAAETPDAPAVSYGNTVLSYRELDRMTDALAAAIAG